MPVPNHQELLRKTYELTDIPNGRETVPRLLGVIIYLLLFLIGRSVGVQAFDEIRPPNHV